MYSFYNNKWDVNSSSGFIGGKFVVSNLSTGYHGILKQWWEYYKPSGNNVLLISENNTVKKEFNHIYPEWNIKTLDKYIDLNDIIGIKKVENENICDYQMDICDNNFTIPKKFDVIISQATLEHLYNPFQSMVNKFNNLNKDGILVLHTHPPRMPYHSYPRDYFRYMEDWWIDLPKYIENIRLIELYTHDNYHVFALYQKI